MPKLHSSKEICKVLEYRGFVLISQKGSHIKYGKRNKIVLTVIVPAGRKQVPQGTFRSILRQANLLVEDFERY
jgi:predicted RNA binding protein YcfA (HicA-like mRNA interferase family)